MGRYVNAKKEAYTSSRTSRMKTDLKKYRENNPFLSPIEKQWLLEEEERKSKEK